MTITALTDTELLEQARSGDEAAFTELYVRHQPAALRLARSYRRMGDPDDMVNGAFERVLGALRRGAGPTESFRAYLFVTLRRLAAEQGERLGDESIDDVPEPIDEAAVAGELAMADREIITRAFESLPDRWQAVLWHTAVEGREPRELSDVLGVSANAAAAMSYRAREKLRQAYLQAHLLADPAPDHEPWRSQLGAYVRDGLSNRDRTAVDAHLEGCASCRALLAELQDVNRSLARAVLPLFLLVGGGKLAAGAAVGGAAAGAAGADKGLLAKLKHMAPTVGSTAAIAAVVGGLVGMGTAVSREDGRPLNSAADAADIGGGPLSDEWGDGDDGDGGGGNSDSLFGDDDFALSPFDDGADDFDLGDSFGLNDEYSDFDEGFGDDFDFDEDDDFGDDLGDYDFGDDFDDEVAGPLPRSGPRSRPGGGTTTRPSSPSVPSPSPAPPPPAPTQPPPRPTPPPPPATNPPPTPPPPATPPPTPPPTTNPPPPPPPPVPAPAPLVFTDASVWRPTGPGTGTLSLTVGEAEPGGADITPLSASDAAQASGLVLDVHISGGAQFATGDQPEGCTVAGANIRCSFEQPPAGEPRTFDLFVDQASEAQTATATITRDGVLEGERVIELTPYAPALSLGDLVPTDVAGATVVRTSVGVTNGSAYDAVNVTVALTLTGDGGFVPFDTDVAAAMLALVARPGGPAGDPLRAALASPLPSGCVGDVDAVTWPGALTDGSLPHTVTCTIVSIGPGETFTIADVLVLAHPVAWDGDGATEDTTVTAEIVSGGTSVDRPSLTIPHG